MIHFIHYDNLIKDPQKEMSNIFKDGVYFIVGNHDIFYKNCIEPTSLKILEGYPKIKIIKTKLTSNKIIKKTYKRKLIFLKIKIIQRNGYESV
jgi:hypothetical protein